MLNGRDRDRADLAIRVVQRLRLGGPSWNRSAPVLLVLMVLAVLGDLLVRSDGRVASHRLGDVVRYFVFAREFGFDELRRGNLALWNPHVFSGTPFVGAFQSAMLYPLNQVHLFFSAPVGINLEILLHVLLLALFTFRWARGWGLSPAAALVSASVAAFGASVSLRVLAGALTVLATYAWVPLLLCSIDELSRRASLGWALVGGFATTMMLFAGHPPTVLMSALVVGLYCVPAFVASRERSRFVACLAAMVLVSSMLAGVQLGTGFETLRESVRQGGMPFDFATSYSFPPENLLTLGIPYLFGTATPYTLSYYGRWWYWDASAFIGMTPVVLVVLGAARRRAAGRGIAVALATVCVILAMGRYTPAYAALYHLVPGFDLLRSPSKFMFFATLFLALLAGMGVDSLLTGQEARSSSRLHGTVALAVAGLLLVGLGAWIGLAAADPGVWSPIQLLARLNDREAFGPARLSRWGAAAASSVRLAGITCVGLAVLLRLSQRRRWAVGLIVAVCLLELLAFARANRGGVPANVLVGQRAQTVALYEAAGTSRVLERSPPSNIAMSAGGFSVWGYDPVVLDRYARFVARSQGFSIADLNNVRGREPLRHHPLLHLVRGRFTVREPRTTRSRHVPAVIEEFPGELPRFLLVGRYTIASGPEAILDTMEAPGFDPWTTVVLETTPDPLPAGAHVHGKVEVLEESTDDVLLDVELDGPAVLVVTDAYARGWRVVARRGSGQQSYRIQPADLVLRGIALEAGHHVLRLEYAPLAYRLGQAVSALGCLISLVAVAWWWRRSRPMACRSSPR